MQIAIKEIYGPWMMLNYMDNGMESICTCERSGRSGGVGKEGRGGRRSTDDRTRLLC